MQQFIMYSTESNGVVAGGPITQPEGSNLRNEIVEAATANTDEIAAVQRYPSHIRIEYTNGVTLRISKPRLP